MKLNIYLLNDASESPGDVLREASKNGERFVEVPYNSNFPPGVEAAWTYQTCGTLPRWVKDLNGAFTLPDDFENTSTGLLVVVKKNDRRFVVTFGYAFSGVESSLIEPDFGLKIVLNSVQDGKLRAVETKTHDQAVRQSHQHLSADSSWATFGANSAVDWLRKVKGMIHHDDFKGSVEGADSIRISTSVPFWEIERLCGSLLELYERDDYLEHFSFVDHLRPLKPTDCRIRQLEDVVMDKLEKKDAEGINMSWPRIPGSSTSIFRVSKSRENERFDDLTLDNALSFIDGLSSESETFAEKIMKSSVIELDDNDKPSGRKESLWNCIIAHVSLDEDDLYVLSEGKWFVTKKSYVKKLREELRHLEKAPLGYDFPVWVGAEDSYNELVAKESGWMLADKSLVYLRGAGQGGVEMADLVTKDGGYIHVKRMDRSATMSHAFSQAYVSSELYRSEEQFREECDARTEKQFGTPTPMKEVFLGVGTMKKGSIVDSIFFFSLVNLKSYANRFRVMGIPLSIFKIEMPPS